MAKEHEKKILLLENGTSFITSKFAVFQKIIPEFVTVQSAFEYVRTNGLAYNQGYFSLSTGLTIAKELDMLYDFNPTECRVRSEGTDKFVFTLKGEGGTSRPEEEISLDKEVFDEYWKLTAGNRLFKRRLKIPYGNYIAELDAYTDRDLFIGEVETTTLQLLTKVPLFGKDITGIAEYKNANLPKYS